MRSTASPGQTDLTFDPEGRLTIDQHGNHRVVRVEPDGQLTVLADKFEGKRLNSPNDLVYRSDGTLYFTDPPFGLPKFFDDPRKELPFSGVFAVKDGNLKLVTKDFTGPNGIAFSPDEKYLYVGDWDEKKKVVMRYEVQPDGSVKNGKLFFDMTSAPGEDALDGMKVDKAGNLYVSGPGGLWILSPEGKHLGTIIPPKHPHNFAWGDADGKTLYLCARSGLYRMRLNIEGVSTVNRSRLEIHSQDGRGPAGALRETLAGISLRGSRARAVHDLCRAVHDSASSSELSSSEFHPQRIHATDADRHRDGQHSDYARFLAAR